MEKLVLLALADHARDDGTGAYPSVARLQAKTGMSRRGVQTVIAKLRSKGVLIPSEELSRLQTVEYTLVLEEGAPDSQGAHDMRRGGRTTCAGGAHDMRKGGAPRAPESSLTVIEPPKDNPPVVPPAGGQTKIEYVQWGGELIEVEMGNRKRVMSEHEREALSGTCRAESMLARLQQKGFKCRIVPKEEVASWQVRASDGQTAGQVN